MNINSFEYSFFISSIDETKNSTAFFPDAAPVRNFGVIKTLTPHLSFRTPPSAFKNEALSAITSNIMFFEFGLRLHLTQPGSDGP